MEPQIIGMKALRNNLRKIAELTQKGHSYIVVRNSKPIFRINPLIPSPSKKYTLADFKRLRFKNSDKNLSKNVDLYLYGS